jgi:hypothetical protein
MLSVSLPSVLRFLNLPKDMYLSVEGNEQNKLDYPYKLPRLVEGKKSYLVFYVWNENTSKLERIRREVPQNVNKKTWIKEKIKSISEILIAGYRICKIKTKQQEEVKQEEPTIVQALEQIFEIRKREVH